MHTLNAGLTSSKHQHIHGAISPYPPQKVEYPGAADGIGLSNTQIVG